MLALMAFALATQPAGARRPDVFSWATSRLRLGTDLAALERRLGPPSSRSSAETAFRTGGCDVAYWVDAYGRVDRIAADVTAACHPAPEGVPITPAMSLGAVYRADSRFGAECLGSCGPAELPTLLLGRTGRIDSAASWSLLFKAADERASETWYRAIGGTSAANSSDGRIIDARNPPESVLPLLRNARIKRIEVHLFHPHAPPVMIVPPSPAPR